MSAATDRLSRLLALVPWLRAHPGVSTATAAEAFGITDRQLRDDLDLLFVCGLPGGAPGDLIDLSYSGDQITVADPQTLDRPLRLSVDEATALVVAARALADVPGLAGRDALDRALEKLEKAVGADGGAAGQVRVDLDSFGGTRANSAGDTARTDDGSVDEVLAGVQQALRERRRVHLRYLVWSRDELTERDVDPMRLLLREGRWYLEGWCHQAEAVRLFRLDRVLGPGGVTLLDVPAAPPPGAVPRDTSDGVYRPSPSDVQVVLDLAAPARWVADYYPVTHTWELPGGWLRVTLQAGGTAWLHRLVLGLGSDARVVEPRQLASDVHDLAMRALAAYGLAAGPSPGPPAPPVG